MRKLLLRAIMVCAVIAGVVFCAYKRSGIPSGSPPGTTLISDSSSFTLETGDLLVRPNWGWLPGSCQIFNGRRYGHVAVVTAGASGNTVDEALSKATVVEALFFDQGTRKFQFHKGDQIRERSASVSFGKRFRGIRYRLRTKLTDEQKTAIVSFARNQLDGGYNILSSKTKYDTPSEKTLKLTSLKNKSWHCATLVWEAFYLATATDIDGNGGLFIYPSDIITAKCFSSPGDIICF
jgi:hypothetical protein